jgi:purine nucleosidase
MTTPLILDVDTGVDDAVALLYACASGDEVELIGATCVMGNVTVDQATRNTIEVLALAGRDDVEVARGAERPLVGDHQTYPVVHGPEGLGHHVPRERRPPSDRVAARLIVDAARERPGEILLVATGPLTNVAIALAEEPGLPDLLKGFALMGGAFARSGNATPAAEANIWMDPDAAQVVFRAFSGVRPERLPIGVGLDVTERALMSPDHLERACSPAPDSPLAAFLRDAVTFYMDFYGRERPGVVGAYMHDPLALAIAMDPSLARLVSTRVEVETGGRWTQGMTVADLRGLRHSPWQIGWEAEDNVRVALDLDEPAFTERLVERLRSLVAARA